MTHEILDTKRRGKILASSLRDARLTVAQFGRLIYASRHQVYSWIEGRKAPPESVLQYASTIADHVHDIEMPPPPAWRVKRPNGKQLGGLS